HWIEQDPFSWRNVMNNTRRTIGTAAVVMCVVASSQLFAASSSLKQQPVPQTLTGCVVAGQSRGSYMVTNLRVDGVAGQNVFYTMTTTTAPLNAPNGARNVLYQPGGTTRLNSAPGNMVYKLDSTKHLRDEV